MDLSEYSDENLDRIQIVIKTILDEGAIRGYKALPGIRLSKQQLEQKGFNDESFLAILRVLNNNTGAFRIFNDLPNWPQQLNGDVLFCWRGEKDSVNKLKEILNKIRFDLTNIKLPEYLKRLVKERNLSKKKKKLLHSFHSLRRSVSESILIKNTQTKCLPSLIRDTNKEIQPLKIILDEKNSISKIKRFYYLLKA